MIIRLYRSKSDIENLSRLKTIIPSGVDRYDYKGQIVHKPWGYEYLMYENKYVSIWILYLKAGAQTSMHCHPTKKTSLIVIQGEVLCSTLEGFHRRKEGDGLIFERAVFHTTKATSRGGAIIMELETPPNKRDLVRLKDTYGREGKRYEGQDQMTRKIDAYDYIDFHTVNPKSRITRMLKRCAVSVCVHQNHRTIHSRLRRESASILCILKGSIHDSKGKTVVTVGDAIDRETLRSLSRARAFRAIMYLALQYPESSSLRVPGSRKK